MAPGSGLHFSEAEKRLATRVQTTTGTADAWQLLFPENQARVLEIALLLADDGDGVFEAREMRAAFFRARELLGELQGRGCRPWGLWYCLEQRLTDARVRHKIRGGLHRSRPEFPPMAEPRRR